MKNRTIKQGDLTLKSTEVLEAHASTTSGSQCFQWFSVNSVYIGV